MNAATETPPAPVCALCLGSSLVEHRHHAGAVRAGLAMHQSRILDRFEEPFGLDHLFLERRLARVHAKIDQRQAAKAAKDFPAADGIRDGLRAQGIELIDRPGGITEWLRG
jgi:cysteinyl-tRNA synthetase